MFFTASRSARTHSTRPFALLLASSLAGLFIATAAEAKTYNVYVHGVGFDNCDAGGDRAAEKQVAMQGWRNLTLAVLPDDDPEVESVAVAYDGYTDPAEAGNQCAGFNVIENQLTGPSSPGGGDVLCGAGNTCRIICHSMGCYLTDWFLANHHTELKNGNLNIEWVAAYASASGGGPVGENAYQAFRFLQGVPQGGEVEIRGCTDAERVGNDKYNEYPRQALCDLLDSDYFALDKQKPEGGAVVSKGMLETALALRPGKTRLLVNHQRNGDVPVFHLAGYNSNSSFNVDHFTRTEDGAVHVLFNYDFSEGDVDPELSIHGENDGAVPFGSACGYSWPGAYHSCYGGARLWKNHYVYSESAYNAYFDGPGFDDEGNEKGLPSSYNPEARGAYNLNHGWILSQQVDVGALEVSQPSIVDSTPAVGATGQTRNGEIVVDFDRAISANSFYNNPHNIFSGSSMDLRAGSLVGPKYAFTYSLENEGTRVRVKPAVWLPAGTWVYLVFNKLVAPDGQRIEGIRWIAFKTGFWVE